MTEGNTNVIQASADVMPPPLTSEGDDLVAWAESHHFTTDTFGTLHSLGCNKMAIIIALEPYDVTELGLNIGQCRVLLPITQQARVTCQQRWQASSTPTTSLCPEGSQSCHQGCCWPSSHPLWWTCWWPGPKEPYALQSQWPRDLPSHGHL